MNLNPYSSYPVTPDWNEAIPFVVTIVVIYAILLVCLLIDYILSSIAIHKMSKNRGIPNGVLGFIPIARDYQFGALAGEIEIGSKKMKNPGLWLVLAPIIYSTVFGVVYFIFIFLMMGVMMPIAASGGSPQNVTAILPIFLIMFLAFFLVALVGQIFISLLRYLVLHKIYSFYSDGQKPVFYLILSIFVPMGESILLFRHRNRPLLHPPESDNPPMPLYGPPTGGPVYGPVPPQPQGQPPYPGVQPPAPPAPQDSGYNPTDMYDNW